MKFANPAPLGLAGFALTTWMLSMVNAGWYDAGSVPLVLASAFAFGGTAQFFAGLLEFPRGNTFGFVAFCAYGAFWLSFALFVEFFAAKVPPTSSVGGCSCGVSSPFTCGLAPSGRTGSSSSSSSVLWDHPSWRWRQAIGPEKRKKSGALHKLGGYLGLLGAALAFYLSAAEVINETRGKSVLPIGPYRDLLSDAARARSGELTPL